MWKQVFLPLLGVTLLLSACQARAEGLRVDEAWARPALAGGNGAAFFVIRNQSGEDDTLISVSSEVAQAAEVHETVMQGEAMQMEPRGSVPVPAGREVVFQPGGLHVMLIGLKQDLRAGDVFSLVLRFERAGEIALEVTVREP